MTNMKWYLVSIEEFSGWECSGHTVDYLVAANSADEAKAQLKTGESWFDEDMRVAELELPNLTRKKKPFVLNIWKLYQKQNREEGIQDNQP
jgi:hypothetical protein